MAKAEITENLKLPYLMAAQAQKHVTHNEALRMIDVLVHLCVQSATLLEPPSTPNDGDRYIAADGALGHWAGGEGDIWAWQDGAWARYEPQEGWIAYIEDQKALYLFQNENWSPLLSADKEPLERLSVNTGQDEYNRISAKAKSTLLSHEADGDVRLSLNRNAESNTASIVLQSGYQGRGEFALQGDRVAIRVNDDQTGWQDAITIGGNSAAVEFPHSHYSTYNLFNVLSDAGRFMGSPPPASVHGAGFETPSWLNPVNSSTVDPQDRFHYDSSTYDGSRSSISSGLVNLMEIIADTSIRRFHPEFHTALITAGNGTSHRKLFGDGVERFAALLTHPHICPPFVTASFYLKVLSGDAGLKVDHGWSITVDNRSKGQEFVVPSNGNWHHIKLSAIGAMTQMQRHNTNLIHLYMQDGSTAEIALPSVVLGQAPLGTGTGFIPSLSAWT